MRAFLNFIQVTTLQQSQLLGSPRQSSGFIRALPERPENSLVLTHIFFISDCTAEFLQSQYPVLYSNSQNITIATPNVTIETRDTKDRYGLFTLVNFNIHPGNGKFRGVFLMQALTKLMHFNAFYLCFFLLRVILTTEHFFLDRVLRIWQYIFLF